MVSGDASPAWQRALEARYGLLGGVVSLDMSGVTGRATSPLPVERIAALDGRSFAFVNGTELAPGEDAALRIFAGELHDLATATVAAGRAIDVTVTGATDALGSIATNRQLARRRAEVVANVLAAAGLDPVIGEPDIPVDGALISSDESRRVARVIVELREAPASP